MGLTFRRNILLLTALALAALALTAGLGNTRIVAYTVPGDSGLLQRVSAQQETQQRVSGKALLLDDSLVHTVEIWIADADYQQMLTTYRQTGLKEYFHADVIIDGVRVNNVGLRLKGNASLRSAAGVRGMGRFGDFEPPQNQDQGNPQPGGPGQRRPPGGFPGEQPANTSTTRLPMMIKFDQFVAGQTYQGYSLLALRTYGITYDAALLHEPVTNAIFRAAGLPAARIAYAGVRINGGEEQLYNLSEVIDPGYIETNFPGSSGVLYKAEVGANLTYLGDDPSAYARRFTQQTRQKDADLAPLIDFIRFVDRSNDEQFARELPIWLDVDAFATYLAINNLLVNQDAIVGMNNNYYLYYDDATQRFSLLYWDGNESLAKMAFGGRGFGGSGSASFDIYYQNRKMGGPRMGGENILARRFLATPAFLSLYEQKLRQVYQLAFVEGAIERQVTHTTAVFRQAAPLRPGLGDLSGYNQAANRVLEFVSQRAAYLAGTALLKEDPQGGG